MTISAIVAISNNRVIGSDNDIPWYLPADLKYFKRTTLNRHIIMGRKTFQSIGRPLPKRTNVVLTRDMFFMATNCLVAHSLDHALNLAEDNDETEAFIIGGGQIYDLSQHLWDKIYLTEVDLLVEGDIFFPSINMEEWNLISSESHDPDEKNEYGYVFKVYERIHA